jgi:Sel1 repeat-containing protein
MYCWSCGHKNADENKYCAECGKRQVRPPAEEPGESASDSPSLRRSDQRGQIDPTKGPQRIRLTDPLVEYPAPKPPAGMFKRRASDQVQPQVERRVIASVPEPLPSDFGLHPSIANQPTTTNGTPKQSNPLVTEPGAIHEKLAAPPPPTPSTLPKAETPAPPKPAANRIGGPSFLGLNDGPTTSSDDGSYLLDDEPENTSSWPSVLALTLLIVFGVILVKEWGPIHYFATTELQKAGVTSSDPSAKRPAKSAPLPPPSVSAGDVAPDAGTVSGEGSAGKTSGKDELAGKSQSDDASNGKAAEKLPMPESDHTASDGKTAKTKESEPADSSDAATRTSKPSPDVAEEESKKTYDNSQIQLAEKYIYGRGVPQDCGRALTLLRTAAGTQNPNAQIKLGALYATGQCVSQDRAVAYGWYSRAKRIQPGNTFLEYSMNSLWASMTEDERRRAQSM